VRVGGPGGPGQAGAGAAAPAPAPGGGFEGIFRRYRQQQPQQATEEGQSPRTGSGLRLSAHAEERLRAAGADAGRMAAAAEAVGRAAAKGGRSTLVLVDGMALLVDVPTRTVVTAVGADRMRERVFTQIDSAVIA
jgi:flagellar operon protein